MQRISTFAIWATLLAPAALIAQDVTTQGTVSVGGGGAFHEGDRPAFQRIFQHKKDGFGGIEELRLTRETKDTVFTFDGRLLPGNNDYQLIGRFEKTERFYAEAGFSQFQVWYDGSGGLFRPTGTEFTLFNEDLSLTRGRLWVEFGAYTANQTLMKLRYERRTRDGQKDSTSWAHSNLVGTYGNRGVVPSFNDIDEVTETFTFDIGNTSQEAVKWNVGARYSETRLNNARWSRRQPHEPAADRQVTTRDQTKTDIFATHGYYLRQVNEKLTLSAGALITKLDANIGGSRIYGHSFDPVYDPAYVRRQQRDEGFYDLHGNAELKQTVLNVNAVYIPKKHWSIRPSLRFENLRQDSMIEFMETNIGAGPAFAAILEDAEADHHNKWDEFAEAIEVRYTGKPNWTFSGKAEWVQGSGELDEKLVVHHTIVRIDRNTDIKRRSQKYSLSSNWYAKPGLSFAAQYYFKGNVNDFSSTRDNTLAGTGNRYPAYISDQDFETHDFNVRMSWRPISMLSLVTRYDNQRSKIISGHDNLPLVTSTRVKSHIISQTATWSPTGRLYLTGNVNVTYDRMESPQFGMVEHSDNNYVTGSLGGGYALAKLDDIYVDYSWFRAKNYADRSQFTLPYGADQKQQGAYLTWVRRQSERLIYTMKYGYVTNRDGTWLGRNNFDAHVIYGRVQYHF
jgi:hypothetical protein